MASDFFLPGRIASAILATEKEADYVHETGSFPDRAVAALKEAKLLGVMIPPDLDGDGLDIVEVGKICFGLGQACGSTGLIYAMHQIEVAMLIAEQSPYLRDFTRRVASEQLLLASVTSEEGVGGSIRTSKCAVEVSDESFILNKKATTISYGAQADALLITARKGLDAQESDQVMVVADRFQLTKTSEWNTIGMRGTCSHGFHVATSGHIDQIFATPFSSIAEKIMLPVSHMLWSCVWLGIATNAYSRARKFSREQIRKVQGNAIPGSHRLVNMANKLHGMRNTVVEALKTYREMQQHGTTIENRYTVEMNGFKIAISESALEVVNEAMMICGILGFKNNTPYSLGRHLGDIHSARLMVSNDRIASNMTGFLAVQRSPGVVF